jgi:3-hydroxybutyryl-CoA dehydrogenase
VESIPFQITTHMQAIFNTSAIVGTGAMGRGIAQLFAQAGSKVFLFDIQSGAAEAARLVLRQTWQRLVEKGKLSAEQAEIFEGRVHLASTLSDLAHCELIVEAVVERLDIKQTLFAELEGIVKSSTVLATNTSSLSVTAIASRLQRPGQLAGYHFFNPVPLMRVVEVIAGLKTRPEVCQQLTDFSRQFGHTPVSAQDTPGFIVNHAGRGFGT